MLKVAKSAFFRTRAFWQGKRNSLYSYSFGTVLLWRPILTLGGYLDAMTVVYRFCSEGVVLFTRKHRSFDSESGFTLVELLIVILIIGVLAAVAIPAFMNQRERANVAALENDMKSAAIVMETWLSNPSNKASDFTTVPGNAGWHAILRYDETSLFPGDSVTWSLNEDLTPDGPLRNLDPSGAFADMKLSEGVGIGVISRAPAGESRTPHTYCIVGSVKNSPYDISNMNLESLDSYFKYALFYDPQAGGLHTAETLPAGGGCDTYYNRLLSDLTPEDSD